MSYLHCHRRQVFREKIHDPIISNLQIDLASDKVLSLFLSTIRHLFI